MTAQKGKASPHPTRISPISPKIDETAGRYDGMKFYA
jgi:hypothetical protein